MAYLAIVGTLGQLFPDRPVIGAAIGPLGFGSGTAAVALGASQTLAPGQPMSRLASAFFIGGVVGSLMTALGYWLPGDTGSYSRGRTDVTTRIIPRDRGRYFALLFVNCAPGMLLLGLALPLFANAQASLSYGAATVLLALQMPLLITGGAISPWLARTCQPRAAFVILLLLRGVLLLLVPWVPSPIYLASVMGVVLVGHGAGFALLPRIVGSRTGPVAFAREYGTVLTAWGCSGAVVIAVALGALAIGLPVAYVIAATGFVAIAAAAVLLRPGMRSQL